MCKIKRRTGALVAVVVDLIFVTFESIVVMVMIFLAAMHLKTSFGFISEDRTAVEALWITIGITAVYCLLEVIAVWKLIVACGPSCQLEVALQNVHLWIITKSFLLLLVIIRLIIVVTGDVKVILFDVLIGFKLFRSICLAINVCMFITELNRMASDEDHQDAIVEMYY